MRINLLSLLAIVTVAVWGNQASADYLLSLRNAYADSGVHRIVRVDNGGNYLSDFVDGSLLSGPTGMAFDNDGNLYVADSFANTILKFDGQTGASLGVFADATDGLTGPSALQFRAGSLYVANLGSPITATFGTTVQKYDVSNGIGTNFGSGHNGPDGLLFDSTGNLYVSQSQANTVTKFDASGAALPPNLADSSISWPAGLAFIPNSDDLLIANVTGQKIIKFDGTNYSTLLTLDSNFTAAVFGAPGFDFFPVGVTFTDDDTFLVSSSAAGMILEFTLFSGTPQMTGVFGSPAHYGINPNDIAFTGMAIGEILAIPVPEPSSIALTSAALVATIGVWRRRRRGMV
jgi:sugar lactone lactonase YvrE